MHHHYPHMIRLTSCKRTALWGTRYQVKSITCVNVNKFWRTDKSSSQCRMMRRLALLWRSLEIHGLPVPVSHDVSPGRLTWTMRTTAMCTN